MKRSLLFITVLGASTLLAAVPEKAFYGGLGASYNAIDFGIVNATTLGISNIYVMGNLVTSGSAGGPYTASMNNQNTFAPSIQAGYFQHFKGSSWLWGAKFAYSYLGSNSTVSNVGIPQYGSNSVGNAFSGTATVQSFQTSINHQMALMPFIGHSFEKGFIYLGAGPSLSQIKTDIDDVVGYAYLDGKTINISGAPASFSSTDWVTGISGLVGVTYFFSPSLFLDLSYNYTQTKNQTNNFSAPFMHTEGFCSASGLLIGSTTGNVVTQALMLTINKAF